MISMLEDLSLYNKTNYSEANACIIDLIITYSLLTLICKLVNYEPFIYTIHVLHNVDTDIQNGTMIIWEASVQRKIIILIHGESENFCQYKKLNFLVCKHTHFTFQSLKHTLNII